MSSLYNVEPPPTAKVVLCTTSGEILLELFAQQTPLASRNFLQLCLDGYYDNTIFHRLVPGFVIQGGDPTGTGSGGQSSFAGGRPFADEFHSRLKFNRRGLLGMANTGKKDDNGSQFFITLDKTEELQGRNTMFGRVEGQTIFNVLKMAEADLVEGEDSERPLYPTMIKSTELLVNPFGDMVKRMRVASRTVEEVAPVKKMKKKREKKNQGKHLLSFGDDEEGDEEALVVSKAKFNPKLVNVGEDPISRPSRPSPVPTKLEKRNTIPTHLSSSPKTEVAARGQSSHLANNAGYPSSTSSRSPTPEPDRQVERLARTNDHIADLTKSLKRSAPTAPSEQPVRKKSALEARMPATAIRGRKALSLKDERRALSQFNAFKARLENENSDPTRHGKAMHSLEQDEVPTMPEGVVNGDGRKQNHNGEDEEANLCDLHFVPDCESCRKWDNAEDEDDARTGLMDHTLTFAKDRMGKDLEWKRQNEKELVVIDPRERAKEIKADKKKSKRP